MRTAKQTRRADASLPPKLQQAREFITSDQPELALDVLASPEEKLLFEPEFWNLMSQAFSNTAQYEDAEQAALTGLSLSPGNPSLLVALAQCQAERGELDQAARNLFKALLKEPRNTAFLCTYAQVLCQSGQLEQAESFLRVAQSIDPEEKEISRVQWLIAYLKQHGVEGQSGTGSAASGPASDWALSRAGATDQDERGQSPAPAPDEEFDRMSLRARQERMILHWIFWPLWPILKVGLVQSWLLALSVLGVLKWQGLHDAAFGWAVFYVAYSLYGCIVPLGIRWCLQRSRT